jgi:dTDP-4-dehydrorhamnose reductase
MAKVLVLGSTGMLGSAVVEALKESNFELLTASRTSGIRFDAESLDVTTLFKFAELESGDYVINCVGLTKSRIDESLPASRASAQRLNVDFPAELARVASLSGLMVIQVATDCVYSGLVGDYTESAPHDALDVYGKTKSLGEIPSESVMHLRCSLIGPEIGRNSLFFEWVRQQPQGAAISGYTDHLWNGLSSKTFGKIILGILSQDLFRPGVQHLVPADQVSKDQLVRLELEALGRHDVTVTSTTSPKSVDRTLRTENSDFNKALFAAAGYSALPTISQMVDEICADLPN